MSCCAAPRSTSCCRAAGGAGPGVSHQPRLHLAHPHEPAERRPDHAGAGRRRRPCPARLRAVAPSPYRRTGDDYAARRVQLAKQRRLRATLPGTTGIWGYVQDVTVGYGFRPLRACAWLLSLATAIGSIAYDSLHPPAALRPSGPTLQPGVLHPRPAAAGDLLRPGGGVRADRLVPRCLGYALIITGWILATTVVTGVRQDRQPPDEPLRGVLGGRPHRRVRGAHR
ncbi:hypothetical protein ACRAWF_03725 [Streptomyces sp. L7]